MSVTNPIAGLTKAQRRAFEAIAINIPPRASRVTLDALVSKGVIEVHKRTVGHDCFGGIVIDDYSVPLPVHMQWCQWCDENISDAELNSA